jgi:class 3 adenylate cyclase
MPMLSFDAATEVAFRDHHLRRDLAGLRLFLAGATVMFQAFGVFLKLAVDPDYAFVTGPAIGTLVIFPLMIAMTYLPSFRRHPQMIMTCCVIAIGTLQTLQYRYVPEPWRGYTFAAMILIVLLIYVTPVFRIAAATTGAWASTIIYLWVAHREGFHPEPNFGQVAGFLLLANILGMGIALLILRSARRDFAFGLDLAAAREESEQLLHNILPSAVAARLKKGQFPIADRYEEATVLFADLVGFTAMAAAGQPEEIVSLLDDLFTRFDKLVDRHGVEKIKTIGDAYMAVAGVPHVQSDHASRCVDVALEMLAIVESMSAVSGVKLSLRIGIATGPVIAGVIGQRKMVYDLWGDTVNTASRLESGGAPGKVMIARRTRDLIESGHFRFTDASIVGKGKGLIEAYVVEAADARAGLRSRLL